MVAQQPNKNDTFELKGTVKNGNGKKIYFNYTAYNKEVSDSVTIVNNHFVFKGHISCPTEVFFETEESKGRYWIEVFLEPTKMNATLDYSTLAMEIKGSKTLDESRLFYTKHLKSIYKQQDSVYKLLDNYRATLSKTMDTLVKKEIERKWSALDKFNDQLSLKIVATQFDYIKNNPDSFLSLSFLKTPLRLRQVTYETANSLYLV